MIGNEKKKFPAMSTTDTQYSLVFEGAVDDSAETIRKVKGVLIADCELSIPEVQSVLTATSAILRHGESEGELVDLKEKLQRAGAKVLIVAPKEKESLESEPGGEEGFEAIFELDSDELEDKPKIEKSDGGVISISDSSESLDDILGQMNIPKGEGLSARTSALFDLEDVPTESHYENSQIQQPPSEITAAKPLFQFEAEEPERSGMQEPQLEAKTALEELNSTLQIASEDLPTTTSVQDEDNADLGLRLEPEEDRVEAAPALPVAASSPMGKKSTPEPVKVTTANVPATPVASVNRNRLAEEVNKKPEVKAAETTNSSAKTVSPPDHDEESEPRESQLLTTARQRGLWKRLRVSPSLDLLLPILIGLVILWIGNSMYMPSTENTSDKDLVESLEKLVANDSKGKETEVKVVGDKTYTGSSTAQRETATVSATLSEDRLKSLSVEVSTPEPPRLTPQQLVRNEVRAPWARKVEVRRLELDQKPDGGFSADGVAKLYVSYKGEMLRALGTIEVTGKLETADSRLVVDMVIKVGEPTNTNETNLEVLDNGEIRFYSKAHVVVLTRDVK